MTRTENKSLLGFSLNYSPLEQMQGTGTDERSDLYSLGATLYHLLTGVRPPDALLRASAVVNGQPDPLQPADEIKEEIATPVSASLMRAMALNIDNRPRTASMMREELHNLAPRTAQTVPMRTVDETTKVSLPENQATMNAPVVSNKQAGVRVVVPVPEETWVAGKQERSGKRWIVGAVLIAGLVALSAMGYLLFSGRDTNRRAQTNSPVTGSSPLSTPSPSPTANVKSSPLPGDDELAARARLEQKSIPFSEAAFTKVVEEGDTGLVELFLAAGMNPDTKDARGRTALINAASRGSNNISQKLLSKGAEVDARDSTGSTALMESARGDHKETTRVLLEKGADVNLTDNNGRTALIRAAAQGHAEIVRLLINKGASVDVKDRDSRSALTWAEINNQSDVIELLRKAGASGQ